MRALEIEDAETEGFLDEDDQALNNCNRENGYSAKAKTKVVNTNKNGTTTGNNNVTRIVGIGAALLLVLLYLSGIQTPGKDTEANVPHHQTIHHHAFNATVPPTVPPPATEDTSGSSSSSSSSDIPETSPEITIEPDTNNEGAGEGGSTEETPKTDGTTEETQDDTPQTEPEETDGSSSSSTTNTAALDHEYRPLKYSQMATIVPDPFHAPLDDAQKAALAEKWGKWHFWDGDENHRPSASYCAGYPNCDIPGTDFPDSSWQVDAVYVNHFLDDADNLLARAKEAIFSEYGHAKPLPPEGLLERYKMFQWDKVNLKEQLTPPPRYASGRSGTRDNGGWTTPKSFDGLVRRLLHAMMTNDEFTVVLAGHSAAAGHGNHFHQSYMMQFHKIMAPILARLGVKLITRNMSQGGLGTLHSSLGFTDLYGDAIDLLLWDTGMTEPEEVAIDVLYRQALLSGRKVPVIWGGPFHLLRDLHEYGDADVGEFGNGMMGVPDTTSAEEAENIPWAARYMKCPSELTDLCNSQKFCAHCWIPRDDLPADPHEMFPLESEKFKGQVRWHPGWRQHQLTGRVLAFAVLDALQAAIQTWSDGTMNGPPLDEDYWHVTDYYDNIRNKIKSMPESAGVCYKGVDVGLPKRVCKTPMHGRGEHTPRFNPENSSLRSIVRPDSDGRVPQSDKTIMYEGPDAHNPCYDIPEGQVDVSAIVSGRRLLDLPVRNHIVSTSTDSDVAVNAANNLQLATTRRLESDIVPGKGWQLIMDLPGHCDGSYNAICGREATNECPASGHHDSRGMLSGNELSGWLVMDLPAVKDGLIILKIVTWLNEASNTVTNGWTMVNNEGEGRRLGQPPESSRNQTVDAGLIADQERHLIELADLPDSFFFDYAINGQGTSLGKAEFIQRYSHPQRVVELITLLDDPGFTDEAIPVEVAVRLRGCGRDVTFGVSHIYWA